MEKLVQIWGSIAGVAEALSVPYPTAQSWARRGIPMRRFPAIISAAKKAGHDLTFEALLEVTQGAEDAA